MTLSQLLKEFKNKFIENLIEIHWKHWTALGVASHVNPERHWIIDLEALIISTLVVGLHDKRLLSASHEWLIKNGKWINLFRLKRIAKIFMATSIGPNDHLISQEELYITSTALQKFGSKKIFFKSLAHTDHDQLAANMVKENNAVLKSSKTRGVVTEVKIIQPALLQIMLRGLFGIDARVEVLIYLLFHEAGNSNSVAKDIFYDQKNIYRILETWAKTGIVNIIKGGRASTYSLRNKEVWYSVIGIKEKPLFLNWIRTFLVLDKLLKALSTSPLSDDQYLLSSFFRDLLNDFKTIAKPLNVQFPDPLLYPGPEYFDPFSSTMLNVLNDLKNEDSL